MSVRPPPPQGPQAGPLPGDATPVLTAQERLHRSREHMTRWLAEEGLQRDARASAFAAGGAGGLPDWLQALRKNPLAALAVEVLAEWWARHPLYTSVRGAAALGREAIVPLVRRHPFVALGTAAVAGAVLVWSRPWRWRVKSALVAGLVSQIAVQVLAQMARAKAGGRGTSPADP